MLAVQGGARLSIRSSPPSLSLHRKNKKQTNKKARKVRSQRSYFLFSLTVIERTGVFCGNLNKMHSRRANHCLVHIVSGLLHSGMIYSCSSPMLTCRHSLDLFLAFHCLVAFKQGFTSYLTGKGQTGDDQLLHERHKKIYVKPKWSNYGWKGKEAVLCVRSP